MKDFKYIYYTRNLLYCFFFLQCLQFGFRWKCAVSVQFPTRFCTAHASSAIAYGRPTVQGVRLSWNARVSSQSGTWYVHGMRRYARWDHRTTESLMSFGNAALQIFADSDDQNMDTESVVRIWLPRRNSKDCRRTVHQLWRGSGNSILSNFDETRWIILVDFVFQTRPVRDVYVEIQSRKIQFYSVTLHIVAHFTGLRYIMFHWPLLSASVGKCFAVFSRLACVHFCTLKMQFFLEKFHSSVSISCAFKDCELFLTECLIIKTHLTSMHTILNFTKGQVAKITTK